MKFVKRVRVVHLLVTVGVLTFCSDTRAEADVNGVVRSIVPETFLSIVAADVHYMDVNQWGVRFSLDRDNERVGSVRIGIFSDNAKVYSTLDEVLLRSSVGPDRDLSGEIGNKAVAWQQKRVLFSRDNVLIDLWLPESETQRVAIQLDSLLLKGGAGVARDSVVEVPKLLDVEMVGDRPKGKLSIDTAGYTAFIDKYGMECLRNYAEKVIFATEGCVMSTPLEISKASLSPGKEAATHEPVDRQKVREYVLILEDQQTPQHKRNQAILALMQMDDGSAVPALIAQVEGSYEPVVKQNAIRALGKIGDKRALVSLLKILKEPVKGDVEDEGEEQAILRRSAVLALGDIGDVSARPVLEAVAQDSKEYQSVRELAAIAAEKIKAIESEGDELRE